MYGIFSSTLKNTNMEKMRNSRFMLSNFTVVCVSVNRKQTGHQIENIIIYLQYADKRKSAKNL
jgi:cytidine deaminase